MSGDGKYVRFVCGNARERMLRRAAWFGAIVAVVLLSQTQSVQAQYGTYNYPPYAQNDYAMTMEGMPTAINVLNNDYGMMAPLDRSSVEIISEPLNGTVAVDDSTGLVWYVPDPDFYGIDGFTYVVSNVNGQVSNVAAVSVGVMQLLQPPAIQNFTGTRTNTGIWVFTGVVADNNPAGITVTFGGLASGTTTTQADGSFSFTTTIAQGTFGEVSAQATDALGLQSGIVNYPIFGS
jgi:hypothetical protein